MFSHIPLRVLEETYGKTLPSMLEELTGVSAKTWKKGGPKRPAEEMKARAGMRGRALKRLQDQGGFSYEEAVAVVCSRDFDSQGPWLTLVRYAMSNERFACPGTEELARQLDQLSDQLEGFRKAGDLPGFKAELLESDFYSSGAEWLLSIDGEKHLLESASAEDWQEITPLVAAIFSGAMLQVLASWDVEFQSKYFVSEKSGWVMRPRPLFKMVMPRLKPGVRPNEDGALPARGLFHLPLRRLVDLGYCLARRFKEGKWPPENEMTRSLIAASGGQVLMGEDWSEQPVGKLRKGIRRLRGEEFASVWESMCGDDRDLSPHPPWPLYCVAQLWTVLLVQKDKNHPMPGISSVYVGWDEYYEYWWDRCLKGFGAKGIRFGALPWPSCFELI